MILWNVSLMMHLLIGKLITVKKGKKTSLVKAIINHSKGKNTPVSKKQRKQGRFSQPIQRLAKESDKKNNFALLRYSWSQEETADESIDKDEYVVSQFDFNDDLPVKDKIASKKSNKKTTPKSSPSNEKSSRKLKDNADAQTDYEPSSYAAWLQGNMSSSNKSLEPSSMGQKKKKKGGKKKTKKINDELKAKIDKSIKGSDEVVTETLAKLYAEQGYHKKALKAYKKLSLKYPEKSGFFAAQIKDLKKKLK